MAKANAQSVRKIDLKVPSRLGRGAKPVSGAGPKPSVKDKPVAGKAENGSSKSTTGGGTNRE